MFFCWLHLHFRWLHPGFHFRHKRFDFFYIYIHTLKTNMFTSRIFFLESTSDQPLVAVPPFFFRSQVPSSTPNKGALPSTRKITPRRLGASSKRPFCSSNGTFETLAGDLSNQKWANKHTIYIYISIYIYLYI